MAAARARSKQAGWEPVGVPSSAALRIGLRDWGLRPANARGRDWRAPLSGAPIRIPTRNFNPRRGRMRDCKRRAPIGQIALCRRMPIFCCFSRLRFCSEKKNRRRPRAWPTRLTLIQGVPTPGPLRRSVLRRGPGAPKRSELGLAPRPIRRAWIRSGGEAPCFFSFAVGKGGGDSPGANPRAGAQGERNGKGGQAGSAIGETSLREARPERRVPPGRRRKPAALRQGAKKWGKSRISLHKTGKLPYNLHLSSGALENISVFQRLLGKSRQGPSIEMALSYSL